MQNMFVLGEICVFYVKYTYFQVKYVHFIVKNLEKTWAPGGPKRARAGPGPKKGRPKGPGPGPGPHNF